MALFERHRQRPLVDLGLRIYERDKEAAGSVVGSAIAFRLFLFFVPLLLFVVGLLGFFAEFVTTKDVDDAGITGTIAQQIGTALAQPIVDPLDRRHPRALRHGDHRTHPQQGAGPGQLPRRGGCRCGRRRRCG